MVLNCCCVFLLGGNGLATLIVCHILWGGDRNVVFVQCFLMTVQALSHHWMMVMAVPWLRKKQHT